MSTFTRFAKASAVVSAAALALSGCSSLGGGEGASGGELSIATGGTGGVYYPLGGGIANVISSHVEGASATVQETNASVDNLLLINDGAADLALALGDSVASAVMGENSFEETGELPICSLGNLYSNYLQPITTDGTGVESIEDMEGQAVSVGAPGSATEVSALRAIEAAGLDPESDIDRRQLGAAETVDALRDGTIAAGFWSGGLPTGALVDLASTGDMKIVPHGEYAADMAAEYGDYYQEKEIPADTYEGQSEAVSVVSSPNIFVVNTNMDEELQENITTAIFENKDELVQVHSAAEELDAANAQVEFIETCPGSAKYYDSL